MTEEFIMNISKIKREKLLKNISILKENIEKLSDNSRINELLSNLNEIETELTRKKYGLVYEEHSEEFDDFLEDSVPVLSEKHNLSSVDNGNVNFLLEGDNLASLYLLNKTHKSRIKLIYIDPPYNRGKKDFRYNDDYIKPEDGFKHSMWLSFMNKRLRLAKELLTSDGAIIISIDEYEFAQLKLLCDEIYGENNFIGAFIRKTKSSTNDADHFLNLQHEYALIYSKTNKFKFLGVPKETDKYKNPDKDPRGPWKSSDPSAKSGGPSTYFVIKNPYTGQEDFPPQGRYWAFSKDSLQKYIDNGKIVFKKKIKNNERGFVFKSYLNELRNDNKPIDSLAFIETNYMNQVATKELNAFNLEFDYPKPVSFIKEIVKSSTNGNDIILDFFAGTGTTGQAVIQANIESGDNRKFILCTNNENEICEKVTLKRLVEFKKSITDKFTIKYFKIEYYDKKDKMYYEYADKLLLHIRELVELENCINFDSDNTIKIVLSDDDLDNLLVNIGDTKRMYVGHDVLMSELQRNKLILSKIEINIIPDYYYSEFRG